jgi:hypothetical protein
MFVPPVGGEGIIPEEIQEWEREKISNRNKWVTRWTTKFRRRR